MKILLMLLLLAPGAHAYTPAIFLKPPTPAKDQWAQFKKDYKKFYTAEEESKRFGIFQANLATIDKLNAKNKSRNGQTPFGVNKFSDMAPAEFKRTHLGFKAGALPIDPPVLPYNAAESPPVEFDWRGKGALTPMKNQGGCGSCWAFAVVQEVESTLYMKTGTLPKPLSPQQVNSCSIDGSDGCNGGQTISTYEYLKQKGLQDDASYPYVSGSTQRTGACKYDATKVAAKLTGYHFGVSPCDNQECSSQSAKETALQLSVAKNGPPSICLNASPWQYYTGGVMAGEDCGGGWDEMNHCVQLAGYTKDAWILRNQWGAQWGDKGFLYLQRGTNTCGLANLVTYADGVSHVGGPTPKPVPTPTPSPKPSPTPNPGPTKWECMSCVVK